MSKVAVGQPTYTSYITGFAISVAVTLGAYVIVRNQIVTGGALLALLAVLAAVQLVAQLYFFLHLGHETKPRWKFIAFLFMLMVLAIVVVGSLWIMQNLNYHMMPAHEVESHVMEDEGIAQ